MFWTELYLMMAMKGFYMTLLKQRKTAITLREKSPNTEFFLVRIFPLLD